MLSFWKTRYPFNDFILVTQKNGGSDSKRLSDECKNVGLDYSNTHNIGNHQVFVAASLPIGNYQNIIFSGVAQHNNVFYFGQADMPNDVDENIGDSVGIFTAILKNKNNIKITQDVIGCGVLFYAEHNENIFVSNRYHLLLKVLARSGFKGELNKSKIATSLYKSKSVFLESNFSSKMDIKGVHQLHLHKEILITEEDYKIVDKESTLGAFNNKNIDRDQLINDAVKEITENVSAVFKSNRFKKVVTDLSGGYDSRVVFAALTNVEDAMDKTEINTRNVPNSRDLEIASGIKNLFGANFYKEDGRSQQPQTVSESLEIWRSYFMGTYYRLGCQAWSPKGENNRQLRLSGGVGEIYRTLWSNTYGKFVGQPKNTIELATKLVSSLPFIANDEAKLEIISLINEELQEIPGKTPLEKLENYYLYFRNRYHYGMRAYEYYHDCPMWFPLLSKSMFNLSMSSFEERNNSKLELELTEKLNPLLIWIDYDKKSAVDNPVLKEIGDIRFKSINISPDSSIDEWKIIDDENKKIVLSSRQKMSHEFNMGWRNVIEHVKHETISVFNELKKSNQDFNSMFSDDFISDLESQENTRYLYEIYARLFSIKDQLDIFG